MERSGSHRELWAVCHVDDEDYEPYGHTEREGKDCSSGCVFYHTLRGERGDHWGVCFNPVSHRCGLLTFEHQGCVNFSDD